METEKFNLKSLLDHFFDIGEKVYGLIIDLEKLEKVFAPIKSGEENFSIAHLNAIKSDWAFLNWWKMPDLSEGELNSIKNALPRLEPKDEKIIHLLFDIFKNIEIVSCILRFVDPTNYGIMSPPVENTLHVIGRRQVEKYLNYLNHLEDLRMEYKFNRIADVDMALWALSVMKNSFLKNDPFYGEIYTQYKETDNCVKRIMAKNSLKAIWEEKPIYRAALLLETDYKIAATLAGRELEHFIKSFCKSKKINLKEKSKKRGNRYYSLPELSDFLENQKHISNKENMDIKEWWETRNELTHDTRIKRSEADVRKMIKGIEDFKRKYDQK
jgi:hypothetical protein